MITMHDEQVGSTVKAGDLEIKVMQSFIGDHNEDKRYYIRIHAGDSMTCIGIPGRTKEDREEVLKNLAELFKLVYTTSLKTEKRKWSTYLGQEPKPRE